MSKALGALRQLIEERLKPGADTGAIDRRIQSMFSERWCVVFTDMAGFSRRARRDGIISFLVLMHLLDRIARPIVREHGGFVLKTIADSLMVLFRDPKDALAACVELQEAIHRYNDTAPEADHIYVGCGIGYGECLKLGDEEIYGPEVNFAAKLGEDLAGPYEIFVTPDAVKGIGAVADIRWRKVPGSRLGGTRLPYFEAVYHLPRYTMVRRAKRNRVRFK
jgi:class 3 adenylate cyclase